jgi:N-acetylglucosamine-6-phosphate deacetylase
MHALANGRIYARDTWLTGQSVLIENGKIIKLCPTREIPTSCEIEDLKDQYLAPGFVDIQVNGGGGVLLNNSPDEVSISRVSTAHRKFGTTSLTPTFITDDISKMYKMAGSIETAIAEKSPGIKGIHFEGPYLNTDRKGVHEADYIRSMDDLLFDIIKDRNLGRVIVTLAPEKVTPDFISRLVSMDVRVCAGHTNATYEQIREALNAGLSGFTHLHNAMPPMQSRNPGVVGAALEDRNSFCGLIADGHHVHPATLSSSIAAKGVDRIMLVTDAMSLVGTDDKNFLLGSKNITIEDGKCVTADGVLAGSMLDMAQAVRTVAALPNLNLISAVRMASTTPATFLGLNTSIGLIEAGYNADFVLLDKDVNVQKTWISGQNL